jgi:hypothetical protein
VFANQVVGISLVLRCGGLGAKLNGLRRHGNCLVGSNMISHTPVIKKLFILPVRWAQHIGLEKKIQHLDFGGN